MHPYAAIPAWWSAMSGVGGKADIIGATPRCYSRGYRVTFDCRRSSKLSVISAPDAPPSLSRRSRLEQGFALRVLLTARVIGHQEVNTVSHYETFRVAQIQRLLVNNLVSVDFTIPTLGPSP